MNSNRVQVQILPYLTIPYLLPNQKKHYTSSSLLAHPCKWMNYRNYDSPHGTGLFRLCGSLSHRCWLHLDSIEELGFPRKLDFPFFLFLLSLLYIASVVTLAKWLRRLWFTRAVLILQDLVVVTAVTTVPHPQRPLLPHPIPPHLPLPLLLLLLLRLPPSIMVMDWASLLVTATFLFHSFLCFYFVFLQVGFWICSFFLYVFEFL